MSIIQTIDLTKYYGTRCAVDRVSISIEAGEIVGLVGPNGAGKTTLMLVLTGLLVPDSGQIELFGEPLRGAHPESRSRIGWVPQQLAFYPGLTVWENLLFFGNLYHLEKEEVRERAAEILARCRLDATRHQLAHTLSGGTQRRLNLALGLVHRPRLLILDEPTVGIDAQSRDLILGYLSELAAAGCGVLLSSHYEEEIRRTCHRVAILQEGRLLGWHNPVSGGPTEFLSAATGLADIDTTPAPGIPGTAPRKRAGWPRLLLLGLALLGGVGLFRQFRPSPPPGEDATRGPRQSYSKNSPDQQKLAFLKDEAIWVRTLDGPEPIPVPGSEGAEPGFLWSPDSREIVFARQQQLWRAGLGREPPALLCGLPEAPFHGGAWGKDGYIVFSAGNGNIYQVPVDGSRAPELLATR